MLLYLVRDTKKNTYSQPLLAPSLSEAINAFTAMNPSNLLDFEIIKLGEYDNAPDLIFSICENEKIENQTVDIYSFSSGQIIPQDLYAYTAYLDAQSLKDLNSQSMEVIND